MNIAQQLEKATEAANRLGMITHCKFCGTPTIEDEAKYFTQDLAQVIVFLDTTLPNFFDEIRMIIDEVRK